ncbi:anaerobic ribonucleoside-triphosphate reductase activating protein [Mitsuokella sp. oral taxon 131]|uniref:anaerobic ribonucleoside-triphosphate reductase activating protein n=1 Tax=Mitsuokella sp. oral taxon 131 TaxID=1321780 RepID=UPI0003AE2AA1|nr:anaerobic ribonucleoside-triphosphate reductase activating protein [Mitsuokella sp. oral taxon 131]ERL04948.1 anaerobic ribonucleoside-triphosphate reductase activating protein [Mitsuokella sp. oral taxon 131 str. W9106]
MNETLQVAGVVDESVVDGDGVRFTIFVQGCPRHCPGCQNEETQPLTGGRAETVDSLFAQIRKNPLLTGVTFSGGEPFLQAAPLAVLAKKLHAAGLDVWCYTGFTFEELRAKGDAATDALLASVDVLVDGDYREAERDLTLHFRGSRNQRVIAMKETRNCGHVVLLYDH